MNRGYPPDIPGSWAALARDAESDLQRFTSASDGDRRGSATTTSSEVPFKNSSAQSRRAQARGDHGSPPTVPEDVQRRRTTVPPCSRHRRFEPRADRQDAQVMIEEEQAVVGNRYPSRKSNSVGNPRSRDGSRPGPAHESPNLAARARSDRVLDGAFSQRRTPRRRNHRREKPDALRTAGCRALAPLTSLPHVPHRARLGDIMSQGPHILPNIPRTSAGMKRQALPYEPVCAIFRRYLHAEKLKFTPERR